MAVATKTKRTRKTKTRKSSKKSGSTVRPKKTNPNGNGKSNGKLKKTALVERIPTLELEEYEPMEHPNIGIEDTHSGAATYAWLGSGQCGGRIVKTLHGLGYRKALAINTTHHDLDLLDLPVNQKYLMDIGIKGAGKDMTRGKEAVSRYRQEILHNCEILFGEKVDHIMVCFGAGGGTGSGSAEGLIELAQNYARHIGHKEPEKSVGAIMTLPTTGEAKSPLIAENAYVVANQLAEMARQGKISPLIIVDNDKISKMYPGLTVKAFWPTINRTFSGLFDVFNKVSALPSPYTAFDFADYYSIMSAGGCCIMGLTKVFDFKDKFTISAALKDNLQKTLLADGFDLKTAKLVGCIVVGGRSLMANTPHLADNIDYAFDVMAEITGDATLHRGIYEDYKESLRVYTIIGGLEPPLQRFEQLVV